MEMQSAESDLIEKPKARWLAREKESGRIYDWATIGSAVVLAGTLAFSYAMLSREAEPGSMLSPPQIALLLIANLIRRSR
jgi:two-component system nitrogen regulation sensor histidine kinase NtrY